MRIDYSLQGFQFEIGSFDATDYLDLLKLTQGAADLGKSLTWTGDFELSFNRKAVADGLTPDDFDPITTPARWRPDQVPVTLTLMGYAFPVLRIKNYVFNLQTGIGRGNLYQVLDVVEGDRPAEEIEVTIQIDGTPLTEVIGKLLDQAFQGATLNPTRSLGSFTGQLDTKLTSRDPVADAQKLVATNYRWLWVDNAEHLRTVSGDPTANPVLFQRSLNQVEWEPDLDSINFAAEKTIVTGQRQVAQPFSTRFVLLKSPQDRTHDEDGRQLKLVVPTYKKLADLYPDIYRDEEGRPITTSDVMAERKTILYRYYGINSDFEDLPLILAADGSEFPDLDSLGYESGELAETVTLTELTMGEAFPDSNLFVGTSAAQANTNLFVAEKLIERDYCKVLYRAKGIINPEAFPEDTNLDLVSAEPISSGRVNADGTVNNQQDRNGGPLKLERGYRKEPIAPAGDVALPIENLKGEFNLQPLTWTPFRKKPYVEDFGFLPSQAHADNLARQIGLREVRRRDAISITMPVPIEWAAAGFPPLHRCQIHNAELQIEQPILVIDREEMSFSFTGGRIGTIPAIPDPPSRLPYVPISGLAIVPVPGIRVTMGAAISSVTLQAIRGTSPYTWAAVDALPSGLSLSSAGVLSGIPDTATAGAYYTVQVTDAASATATVEVWIQVVAIVSPTPMVATLLESLLTIVPQIETRLQAGYRNASAPTVVPEIATAIAPPTSIVSVVPEIETILTMGGGGGGS